MKGTFRQQCLEHFPLALPNTPILKPNLRLEPDHVGLFLLDGVCWADINEFLIEKCGDGIFYISDDWLKYFLPAFMCFSVETQDATITVSYTHLTLPTTPYV